MVATVRPRQWIKNALVIAAAGAAGALGHDDVPIRVTLACLAFCLLASGIYAINDVHDAKEDRRHPRKRLRPVAAGELDPRAATSLGLALMLAGLVMCVEIRPALVVVGVAYVVLTLSYTMIWRRIPVLDLLAVAGGFVLRAVAGGVAPPVRLSVWFVLVVSSAAVFVAAGKRQSELARIEDRPGTGRRVLGGLLAGDPASDADRQCSDRAVRVLRVGVRASKRRRDSVASDDDRAVRRVPAPLSPARTERRGRGAGGRVARRQMAAGRRRRLARPVRTGCACRRLTARRRCARQASVTRSPDAHPRVRLGRRSACSGDPDTCPTADELQRCSRRHGRPSGPDAVARGMGRSYGDAAQLTGGLVLDATALKRFDLDPDAGTVTADAGVTIGELLDVVVPAGWMVAVVPGTQHVTVGGAIAADIHGKNHGSTGTFGAHVEALGLLTSGGEVLELEPGGTGIGLPRRSAAWG